ESQGTEHDAAGRLEQGQVAQGDLQDRRRDLQDGPRLEPGSGAAQSIRDLAGNELLRGDMEEAVSPRTAVRGLTVESLLLVHAVAHIRANGLALENAQNLVVETIARRGFGVVR